MGSAPSDPEPSGRVSHHPGVPGTFPSNSEVKVDIPTQRVTNERMSKRPAWHWQAIALWSGGATYAAIAEACGKAEPTVKKVMVTPWAREQRRLVLATAARENQKVVLDPSEMFRAKGPRMAEIMVQAAEDEDQPLKKAMIAEKALALGGWTPVQRSVHLDLRAKLRDRNTVSDEELVAYLNGGPRPAALEVEAVVEGVTDE